MPAKPKAARAVTQNQIEGVSLPAEINYRSIFESAGEGIYQTTPDGKFLAANPAMARILGFDSPEELIRERTDIARQGYVIPAQREEFKKRIERDGTVSGFECEVYRKDGSTVWVSETARAIRDERGKIVLYEGFLEDITARKRAEESLRKSEAHMALAQQVAHLGSWELDLTHLENVHANRLFWSDETFRIFGYKPGSVAVTTELFFSHVHPDDRATVAAAGEKAVAEKKRYSIDHRIVLPGGEIRHVHEAADIVTDEKTGRPVKMTGAVMDITARKRAEEGLLESQALYHSFVEHLPASVFRKDREGRYVFVNSMFCRLKNLKAEEVLGKTPRELALYEASVKGGRTRPRSRQSTLIQGEDHHELIVRTGKPVEMEESYPQPDGSVEYFHAVKSPVFGPDKQIIGTQGIQFDITARKRAEEELFKSQQMLRTILDTIPQRVFWKDRNSIYLGCNKPLARDCGFDDPSKLIGKDDYETKSAATAELYRADDRRVMESGRSKLNYEEPQIKADGTMGWLRTSKVPLFDKDGSVTGVLGTYEDITERKRLEEQLRQAQKMDAFGQLAAGVAHDFNNILTVVQGNLSLLQMGLDSKAEETAAIEQARAAAERAANLTRQLLTFGRRQPMQTRPLDMNQVVANMTKMLQRIIGEHIELEANYASAAAPVQADVNMMEQILINLAVNSRDAMPRGGKLAVAIKPFKANGQMPDKRSGEFVRLTVADTGAGIAPEHLPHIFEPFFTTKDVGKGTGLGLATVFGIVQQHDGWIEVESKPGEGATFHVFLPRLPTDTPLHADPSAAPTARGGDETILLVEDEIAVRELMKMLLAHHGYKIHEANSGKDALTVWSALHDRIDLLITDMVMPDGISGHELAERLRAEKPSLKVIYCSGYSDDMLGDNSPLRAKSNFLEKPFETQKLLQCVRDSLDSR